jgi:hypothetical protein
VDHALEHDALSILSIVSGFQYLARGISFSALADKLPGGERF